MIKKNLTHLHVIVTKQTYWKVRHWAEEMGWTVKDMGRIIDRLVREKALQESTSRRFEEKRADAWRLWPRRSRRKTVNTSCRSRGPLWPRRFGTEERPRNGTN